MRTLKNAAAALAVALLLVVSADHLAFAATGKSLLLGKSNQSPKLTTLKRTSPGPALKLTTKSTSSPPLAVNGRGRVANLNADRLDGLDASAFAPFATKATADSALAAATAAGGVAADALDDAADAQEGVDFAAAMVPVAVGVIASDGQVNNGYGITASTWNAGFGRYEITLSEAFHYVTHAPAITPFCTTARSFRYGSVSDQLLVFLLDGAGNPVQCGFAVTVTRVPSFD